MIIDGHAHACGDFLNVETIRKTLDRNQVDKVVLVPGEPGSKKTYNLLNFAKWFPKRDVVAWTNAMTKAVIPLSGMAKHIPEGNAYVASCARQAPDRIIQFYWVQLHQPHCFEQLEQHYQDWQFQGLKLHQCWESFSARSEEFDRLAGWAAERRLPIFFHVGAKSDVLALIEYLKTHPRTTFIIAHLFGLEEYIKAGLQRDNLFFEISTPPLISVLRLEKAIAHFGARKIIFGSDTPYGKESLRWNLRRVKELPISEAEKRLILGENMQRILAKGD